MCACVRLEGDCVFYGDTSFMAGVLVIRGSFPGSQAGIKGYGLSQKRNACHMAARMS